MLLVEDTLASLDKSEKLLPKRVLEAKSYNYVMLWKLKVKQNFKVKSLPSLVCVGSALRASPTRQRGVLPQTPRLH
jgi:hypothetical protein